MAVGPQGYCRGTTMDRSEVIPAESRLAVDSRCTRRSLPTTKYDKGQTAQHAKHTKHRPHGTHAPKLPPPDHRLSLPASIPRY